MVWYLSYILALRARTFATWYFYTVSFAALVVVILHQQIYIHSSVLPSLCSLRSAELRVVMTPVLGSGAHVLDNVGDLMRRLVARIHVVRQVHRCFSSTFTSFLIREGVMFPLHLPSTLVLVPARGLACSHFVSPVSLRNCCDASWTYLLDLQTSSMYILLILPVGASRDAAVWCQTLPVFTILILPDAMLYSTLLSTTPFTT